jgi:exodeoxyribonuclease-3
VPATRLISWNVNGARAVYKKGFSEWLHRAAPDILCLQETRAEAEQLEPAMAAPRGYHTVWNPSRAKRGHSGTSIFSRRPPKAVELGFGDEEFDIEGRTIVADFEDFVLLNAYFPNGRRDHSRVPYKLRYCELFLATCEKLRAAGRSVIFCGDLNTSHRDIDLARPASNRNTTGFLPEERAWIDRVVEAGWIDSFRQLSPALEGAYTWWSMPMRARERNVGWRLDYFFISPDLAGNVQEANILADVLGSDHCPVELVLSEQEI